MAPDHQEEEEGDDDTDINPVTLLIPPPESDGRLQNRVESQQPQSQEQQHYHLHSIERTLVIRQLPSQGLSFKLWPAAATLLNLLDRHASKPTASAFSSIFSNLEHHSQQPRILELGAGTGLAGISAAAILGARVTVTDLPHVLPNLNFNVEANSDLLAVRNGIVEVKPLSWGEMEDMEAIGRDYDLILGSDVVYHDHLYDPLLSTLKFLLGGEKKMVFVMAHLKRWKKESAFFKKAKKLFHVGVIHIDAPLDGCRVGVTVYRFVRKGC